MLRELRVRDLAVIENVTVPFEAGLNVLSGETGAGKSILIDAVLLLCGGRAQADVIRADGEAALVEGRVRGRDRAARPRQILSEAGLAADDGEIVIRRELVRSGRHRAFVNDSPVTVALLESAGRLTSSRCTASTSTSALASPARSSISSIASRVRTSRRAAWLVFTPSIGRRVRN